ncbi:MAG: TPM domain-containing protein [Kiritimatiellaeota bacterium]|nr:TPM domain-containing protein [Kiritimatiellota bacterium]
MHGTEKMLARAFWPRGLWVLACVWAIGVAAQQVPGVSYPPKPGDREFISDQAELLTPEARKALKKRLDKLLTDKAIPIIVVTIPSLAQYGAQGMRIELYARLLFDHWGIGHPKIQVGGRGRGRRATVEWNKGILLLISVGDRKARIELGAGFGREKDKLCGDIMRTHIIPFFKRGDFAGGIEAGVKALEQMAREEVIEPPPRPWWHYAVFLGAIALTVFTISSLIRHGTRGWAWLFWGAALGLLWFLVYNILMSSGRSGGFGGGSFGGGFSGGGGATGSW